MLLMDYPSIRGEYLPDYAKKSTCNILHAYMDTNSKKLIDKHTEYEVQEISRFQPQCAKINFYDQSRYNRLFQQIIQKGKDSEINYIKIFKNDKALEILV